MAANKTVLTLLAHPDDAEFLCAGTLIRLADAGWDIHIATATPGDCGTMTETRWDIASIRTKENREAVKLVNGAYHCLDERDVFVTYDKTTVQKAVDLFRLVAPSLAFTHAPKDYMMDHEMISLVTRAASFAYGAPNASAHPLKEDSGVPHLYYCDALECKDPYGNEVTPTTYVDITDQYDKKVEMLACHVSQRQWLRDHHGMDEYIESMKRQSAYRGEQVGVTYAEAFVQHKGHAYPQNDLLKELFG